MASKKDSKKKGAPTSKQIEDWINAWFPILCLLKPSGDRDFPSIHYSDRYSDDEFEFRHVILPKPFLQVIPKHLFNPDKSGTLRLLTETEWRAIGIRQSTGWEHYEVHGGFYRFSFIDGPKY